MNTLTHDHGVNLFSTCPPMSDVGEEDYVQHVIKVARWSERCGYKGILVYSDNSKVDPWIVSHIIIQNTGILCPLIAVQPVYMHPFTVAKNIASISALYKRRVYLNMVAGGFKNDLIALNDNATHDDRYRRLVEYTQIVMNLLQDHEPCSYSGEFYQVSNLKLNPGCAPDLLPGIFVSGSSEAGLDAAKQIGATAIQYPKKVSEYRERVDGEVDSGVRVGIISRQKREHAWTAAHERFPADHRGQLTRKLANSISDSEWHKQLAEQSKAENDEADTYWLVPYENYKTNCPYLVGDYQEVGRELASYIERGYRTFITDVPQNPRELDHIGQAFDHALDISGWQRSSMTG